MRLIDNVCARPITIGKMCQHILSILTLCRKTSTHGRFLKIPYCEMKGIVYNDKIYVKNKQLFAQLKYLFSFSNLDLFYSEVNSGSESYAFSVFLSFLCDPSMMYM